MLLKRFYDDGLAQASYLVGAETTAEALVIDPSHRASLQSLAYARSISPHITAVHVAIDAEDAHTVRAAWQEWQQHVAEEEETQLVVIESPYRSLSRPLLAYIDTIRELHPEDTLTVILPEFVVAHWWEHLLHNQTALRLKAALFFRWALPRSLWTGNTTTS